MNKIRQRDSINTLIYKVRDQDVMLDSDLAEVYGVGTKRINESVSRNPERFPEEFSFQLEQGEWDILRSQSATSRSEHGGRRHLPRAFTEHGAVMLATVLNSPRAIEASKDIVRAFVRLRHAMASGAHMTAPTIDNMLADPRLYAELFANLANERERRELLEDREGIFGNRTRYGEISKKTGLPRTEPTHGYLRSPRTVIDVTTITIMENQMRLFDWD